MNFAHFYMNFVPIFITFYMKKRIHRLVNMTSNHLTIHILQSCGRDSPDGILSKIHLFIYATRSNQNILIRGRICRAGFRSGGRLCKVFLPR